MSNYLSRLRQQTGLVTPVVTAQTVSEASTRKTENALEIAPDTSNTEALNTQLEAFNTAPRLDRKNSSIPVPPASTPLSSTTQETPQPPSQIISTSFPEHSRDQSNDWTAFTAFSQPGAQTTDEMLLSQPIAPDELSEKTPHQENQSSNPIYAPQRDVPQRDTPQRDIPQRDFSENAQPGDEQWTSENQQVALSNSNRLSTETKNKQSDQTASFASNISTESTQSAYLQALETVRGWVAQPTQSSSTASLTASLIASPIATEIATEILAEPVSLSENTIDNQAGTSGLPARPTPHLRNLSQDHFPSRPQPQADNTVISIGSIQVTVEAPPEQIQKQKAQLTPQKTSIAAPARLSRHYLRL